MLSMDQLALGGVELQHDPLVYEHNKLQDLLKEKEKELEESQNEIKALRATEAKKDKAIDEISNYSNRVDEKLRFSQNHLERKNLEIKKLENEIKEALAAQYAAESTLRRVHANRKDDDSVPIATIVAPLEADIKIFRREIAALQEDNKALERLNKSKEFALLEAEKILRSALERTLIVEEIQSHNFELKRRIEICQEENDNLDKTYRQKVLEVEKLTRPIKELEEAISAGAGAANIICDCQRQIAELKEDKRILERELLRIRIPANRVATAVANEWKDDNDKVMPVKQWLEERRVWQADTQRLREKLALSERTAKAETQIKDKLKLRLKTLEEGLKHVSNFSQNCNAFCSSSKPAKSGIVFGFLSSHTGTKENKKSLWAPRRKVVNGAGRENQKVNEYTTKSLDNRTAESEDTTTTDAGSEFSQDEGSESDMVSGFLYDRLQKELIILRRSCETKENNLGSKDQEIKVLRKKIDTSTKAIEVKSRRLKKESVANREKVHHQIL